MKKTYILSFSQGNYLKSDGGVDKVISEHVEFFNKIGYSYVHIAPLSRKLCKNKAAYSVVIDGQFKGVYSEYRIFNMLLELNKNGYYIDSIFIHHIYKFNMDFFDKIFEYTKAPVIFYIHDYFTICRQYNLLRDGSTFCGVESPCLEKCKDCSMFDNQEEVIDNVRKMLTSIHERLTIVAPSQCALDIWTSTYTNIDSSTRVVPHQMISEYTIKKESACPVSVGYMGRLIKEKGADLWKRIRASKADYINLFYFGISDEIMDNVEKQYVLVTPKCLTAMSDAVKAKNIDIMVMWSIWPETYSYAYFEAYTAGCYIITNENSGNIADMIKKNKRGKVFNTEDEVIEFLNDKKQIEEELTRISLIEYPQKVEFNTEVALLLSNKKYSFSGEINKNIDLAVGLEDILYRFKYREILK